MKCYIWHDKWSLSISREMREWTFEIFAPRESIEDVLDTTRQTMEEIQDKISYILYQAQTIWKTD